MAAITRSDLREDWRQLKRSRPGHRFQDRYERARRSDRKCGSGQRIALLVGGLICLMIGIVLTVIPGPAIPFLFLAGGMLATESRTVARFMDWSEVQLGKILAWARRHWRRYPTLVRIALIILGACCSAGTAYFGYRIMRG